MRLRELMTFALGGLWRQKMRTALTLIGVMVGTCALAFSLALGFGLRAFIEHEFKGREDFWRIMVHADEPPPDAGAVPEKDADRIAVKGEMSPDRRARIGEALLDRYLRNHLPRRPLTLTPEKLDAITRLPDVREIRTYRNSRGRLWLDTAERPAPVSVVSGRLDGLAARLIAGRLPESPGAKEVIVSELALYDLGLRDDGDLAKALGRPVRLEVGGVQNAPPAALALALVGRRLPNELTRGQTEALEKLLAALPRRLELFDLTDAEQREVRRLLDAPPESDDQPLDSTRVAHDTYRISGVVRLITREERKKKNPLDAWELFQGDVLLAPVTGEELFGQLPMAKGGGFHTADVRVVPGGDVPGTAGAIEAMGFRTFSASKWFASAKREVTLIAAGLNLFAMIALFVAAIGITNTLVTSVVERTREIGILRAVGATKSQVMGLFITEGAFIGLAGSLLGLGLARALAVPADRWVWGMIEKIAEGERLMGSSVFVFPPWLHAASVLFAVLVTTAAAYYPAQRAARIHPIDALRYG